MLINLLLESQYWTPNIYLLLIETEVLINDNRWHFNQIRHVDLVLRSIVHRGLFDSRLAFHYLLLR